MVHATRKNLIMRKSKLFTDEFRDSVLDVFQASDQKSWTESQLAKSLGLRGQVRKRFRLFLNAMVLNGDIVKIRQNHYSLGEPADLVTGEIDIVRSGNAFVSPYDGSSDVFIPRDCLSTALPHDRVVVRLEQGETVLRRAGKVIRILKRSRRAISGTLKKTRNFYYVVPVDPVYAKDFYVSDPKDANAGDRVVIQFIEWEHKHVSPEAEIIEVIGPASNPSLDTLAIMRHYGLSETFLPEVLHEAETSPERMDHPGKRRNFRDRFIFTIDPAVSRDFDDAISLEMDKDGRRVLGVHIADVSHFVKPGAPMDVEAHRRGNSVYLPDKVLPMLPEQLSNGLCSLRPHEDRLTFSVLITFDKNGNAIQSEFCRSVIRSKLRLNYEQVFAALQGDSTNGYPPAKIDADAMAIIRQVHQLAQQLRKRRFAKYALDLDMPEYKVVIGPDGMIVDIRKNLNDISHQLIEECMVAANEAVDKELSLRGFESLHRIHEPPPKAKVDLLEIQLREMGFHPGDMSKRSNMSAFLKSVTGNPLEHDVKVAVLKSMKRAMYSNSALGHYGLAKKFYTHFTSPIRRYSDLVVHRILAAGLTGKRNPYAHSALETIGIHASKTEQVAENAEKMLIEIKKYRFLQQQIDKKLPLVYDAIVVNIRNFGMFVELPQLELQGLVHISSITDGFVRYNEQSHTLKAESVEYSIGTRVKVHVNRVDFDKHHIDFTIYGIKGDAHKGRTSKKRHVGPPKTRHVVRRSGKNDRRRKTKRSAPH